ncbi:MAG TPA: UDP-glucose 4-epimerase GalE [Gammaproteobacteria bacterium]
MKEPGILVTGGAGYIGSHALLRLRERPFRVVVLDDLSTGREDAVLHGELIRGDVGDTKLVQQILREHDISLVMHFAAKTVVPESVEDPLLYYDCNTAKTRNLIACCIGNGVRNFVFSSTAAVYGVPPGGIAREDSPLRPINPYGASKLMSETMLADVSAVEPFRHVTLRYFNVAGSDPERRIGQSKENCTLLTKVACEAAMGLRRDVKIYGTDYDTPDGTGVRDYVHVDDIARAHVAAADYLFDGGESVTLNCGYGHGYSVREVMDAMQDVHGAPIDIRLEDRRPGDPPTLIADASRIRSVLGWKPEHDDLEEILQSALDWEHELQRRRHAAPAHWRPAASGNVVASNP